MQALNLFKTTFTTIKATTFSEVGATFELDYWGTFETLNLVFFLWRVNY